MKEYTVVMNLQVTAIGKAEQVALNMLGVKRSVLEALDADDVQVTKVKVFERDADE